MSFDLFLYILAVIFFVVAGFQAQPRFNWTAFGFACITATFIL